MPEMYAPLRVLFVNPGLAMGGAEHSLLLLLRELRQRDVLPTVALFGPGPFADALARLEIATVQLDLPEAIRTTGRYDTGIGLLNAARLTARALPGATQLARLARSLGAELIHTNGLKAHLMGGVAGKIARRPVVWHVRDFPPSGAAGTVFRTALATFPAGVIVNSMAVTATLCDPTDPPEKPIIRTIYNPIDPKRFNWSANGKRIRAEMGVAKYDPLIGMVAHLTPWKGHEDFLRIAALVLARYPEARFLIAGGEIYETTGHEGYGERLHRLAAELGIADKVHFLGDRDDIPDILRGLDLLVHCPTAPEPFGRIIAEAQACGVPIVASDAAGPAELLVHNTSAMLVPPGDVQGFADVICELWREQRQMEIFRGYGHQQARLYYNPGQHADSVLKLYRLVMR